MTLRQVLLAAVVLGCVAGAVVWYLERFEANRLHDSFSKYLQKYEEFRRWEAQHGDAS